MLIIFKSNRLKRNQHILAKLFLLLPDPCQKLGLRRKVVSPSSRSGVCGCDLVISAGYELVQASLTTGQHWTQLTGVATVPLTLQQNTSEILLHAECK